jgi:peptidoglycan/LPS O-acetylase OafA/YrhL
MTLQDRMTLAHGHAQGFDYLRITLAVGVVLWHTVVTCYGQDTQFVVLESPVRPLVAVILPMFFALSGFLVAGSLERCRTLFGFLSLRALRLIPALAVEVVLSAVLVGPLVSDLPARDYFASPEFSPYFLNILGDIHYVLPGVFTTNPWPSIVNGQLYTVPFEMKCYLLISLYALAGLHRRRWMFLGLIMAIQVAFGVYALASGDVIDGLAPGGVFVLCFLVGIGFFLNRHSIIHSHTLGALSVLATIILLSLPNGDYFVPIPITYFTVYLGLLNPPHLGLIKFGDYSYGIFLYGFPVQQTVAHLGSWTHNWAVSIALSLPLAACVAALSWHGVEVHALKLRRYLPAIENALASSAFARFSRFKPLPIAGE